MMRQIEFGFQYTVQGERIGEEWHQAVAEQAQLLEQILYQLHETVSDVQRSGVPQERQHARLCSVFEAAARVLTSRAQRHANLESQIATIRRDFSPSHPIPPGAENRLRVMEQVNATMHANLARARQRVDILRQATR